MQTSGPQPVQPFTGPQAQASGPHPAHATGPQPVQHLTGPQAQPSGPHPAHATGPQPVQPFTGQQAHATGPQPTAPAPAYPSAPPTPPAAQYGVPGATYGGFGAFEPKTRRSRKPWLIGAVVVLVVAGGAGAAWGLGVFDGPTLDRQSVQDGVARVLRDDFGERDVANVSCPEDQPVRTGTTFDCSATVAGQPKKITVRVLNDEAQYEVGAPK